LRRAGDGLEHFPRRGARFQEPICGNWRPPAATSSDKRSLTTWLSFCASATPPAVRRTHNASRERPPDPSPVLDRVLLPRQDGEHDLVEPGGLDGGDALDQFRCGRGPGGVTDQLRGQERTLVWPNEHQMPAVVGQIIRTLWAVAPRHLDILRRRVLELCRQRRGVAQPAECL